MSNVIPLPWVALDQIRPDPHPVRSVVIRTQGGRAVVAMQPAVTGREKRVREVFDDVDVARVYARRIHAMYPTLYRRVIDETGGPA
jgi:hypothetical protein